jgi:hypothetical protein
MKMISNEEISSREPAHGGKRSSPTLAGLVPQFPRSSHKEVREQATADSDTIFRTYKTLHEIVKRHEPTIQKRWTKRTR